MGASKVLLFYYFIIYVTYYSRRKKIIFRDKCSSIRQLPATPPSACDVIGSVYALQFLIHSVSVIGYKLTNIRFSQKICVVFCD